MVHHRVRRKIENNFDAFLTLAALLIGVLTSLPFGQGHTHSTWELILAVAAWLPLLGRNRWPLPVAAIATAIDAIHIAVAAHMHPPASIVPTATMLGLYTVACACRHAPRGRRPPSRASCKSPSPRPRPPA